MDKTCRSCRFFEDGSCLHPQGRPTDDFEAGCSLWENQDLARATVELHRLHKKIQTEGLGR